MKPKTKTDKEIVMEETRIAYCDSTLPWGEAVKKRKLDFLASRFVKPGEARQIFAQCVPGGYNSFRASLMTLFPGDCRIRIAREGSVCIYVRPGQRPLPDAKSLHADEWAKEATGLVRIWWD